MKKALIVDDNEQNLYIIQTMLKGHGYDVMMAENGVEALEQARRVPPDIVISDILMPVMDGFALCREWRKDERLQQVPFVFYTATYTDPRDEELALSLGAARFVVKPQDPGAFTALVREVIEGRETGRLVAPSEPIPEETDYYKLYSEALVGKLEDKMLALEQLNRRLGQEITERKRTEEAIRESEERFRTVFERSTVGKSLTAPDGKLLRINKVFAEMLDYTIEEMEQLSIAEITHPDDMPESRECIRALLSGERIVYRFDKRYIHKRGDIVWADVSATLLRDGNGMPLFFITDIVDITGRKRAEEQLQHTLDSLRKAVNANIQIMASTVEARDTYIAGHQRRVADLCRAIAQEMGIPEETVEGLYMAAMIHDLGKISVPVEILSKPSKLSKIEFSLIKTHVQAGYDILKTIEFPWPVARMVLEHHERMDGSGYPNGLSGEQILRESRILAVADVVEAIASHRPYRPALGTGKAMEEIESNKGIFYDPEAVDACLKIFKEKGFAFG